MIFRHIVLVTQYFKLPNGIVCL